MSPSLSFPPSSFRRTASSARARRLPIEVSTELPFPMVEGHIISEVRRSESVICVRQEKTTNVCRLESLRDHVSKESTARVAGTGGARIRIRRRNNLEDRADGQAAHKCGMRSLPPSNRETRASVETFLNPFQCDTLREIKRTPTHLQWIYRRWLSLGAEVRRQREQNLTGICSLRDSEEASWWMVLWD